jgi:hypothetical protein
MAAVDGGSDVLDEFPGRFALLVEKTEVRRVNRK